MTGIEVAGLLVSGGVITAVINWLRNAKKDSVDSELRIGRAWRGIADELQEQLHKANQRISALETALQQERKECDLKMDALRKELMAKIWENKKAD